MNDELRTDFTAAERNTIIAGLRDEYGDREFSDELVLLECQDMWRKGCHSLEDTEDCRGCTCCSDMSECPVMTWEKRHPEYKDDALAKRLKELRDEMAGIQRAEIEKSLLAKGYVKVQWSQFNDGEMTKSDVKLYQPGSNELRADIANAIENWKSMWGVFFELHKIDLNAKSGILLELGVDQGDEYEIWEIV